MNRLPANQHGYKLASPTGKWTLSATILASSMAFIDTTALNVILPSLQKDLNATGPDLFWVLNSYLLMLGALIIVGGSLGDKLGRVRVFKFGIILFTLGSILCGFSPNVVTLILFRMVQGLGGAFMIPGSLAIISAVFDRKEKGRAFGTWSAFTTMVTIGGPALGGVLADQGLWRLIFFINVPLGILAVLILHFHVPESRQSGQTIVDWKGALFLVLGLGALTFAFLEMPEFGFDHPVVVSSFAIGSLLLGLFLVFEHRNTQPMVPLSLFADRTFFGINLLTFLLYAALGGTMLFLSLNLIQVQGYSQLEAGLSFLPFSICMLLLARQMGKMTDRFGARPFLIMGPLLAGLGMWLFSRVGMTEGPKDFFTTYLPPLLVFAIGMAITVVPLTTAVMNCVDEDQAGVASGINNSITRISGIFMNAILGAVAVFLFAAHINTALAMLPGLDPQAALAVRAQAINLGAAQVPDAVPQAAIDDIQGILDVGFIRIYQQVSVVGSLLSILAALIAWVTIRPQSRDE